MTAIDSDLKAILKGKGLKIYFSISRPRPWPDVQTVGDPIVFARDVESARAHIVSMFSEAGHQIDCGFDLVEIDLASGLLCEKRFRNFSVAHNS